MYVFCGKKKWEHHFTRPTIDVTNIPLNNFCYARTHSRYCPSNSRLVYERYVNYIKQRYTHSMTCLTFFVFSMQMIRQQCWRSNLKDPVLLLLKRLCVYFDDCFPASGPPPVLRWIFFLVECQIKYSTTCSPQKQKIVSLPIPIAFVRSFFFKV